ncbi:MAG: RNA polymerase sigma factor [Mangrovibacterium sp.]
MPTDHDLWQKLKTGDKSCFNLVFRKYFSELYYYGLRIVPDEELVRECIQEVFIRIWETRSRLAEVVNVKAYLIVCLRRMILAGKKNVDKQMAVRLGTMDSSAFFFDLNEFERHEEISDEVKTILLHAVNALTVKQRELIVLFFYHGLSYEEIAKVTGITVPAVRNLMCRSLSSLREKLDGKSAEWISNQFFMLFSSVKSKKNPEV